MPTDGNVTVDGGLLDLAGYNQTIGALSGTGGFIALGSDILIAGTADSTTFAGAIFGSGAFVKVGGGMLTLTGANNYTGGSTISAGTSTRQRRLDYRRGDVRRCRQFRDAAAR